MNYNPDLRKISVKEYRKILQNQNLLPSRRLLLDDIAGRFARLEALGIGTVAELLGALSSPAKIAVLAERSGVPADYLMVLKREAGTLNQKPVKLADFPDTDAALIAALNAKGVKNSKDYWESPDAGGELYALCDLVRINGVGPYAAKMFCEAGYRSVPEIAGADAETMLRHVTAVNEVKRYYQGKLGKKDMQFCIDFANLLTRLSQ